MYQNVPRPPHFLRHRHQHLPGHSQHRQSVVRLAHGIINNTFMLHLHIFDHYMIVLHLLQYMCIREPRSTGTVDSLYQPLLRLGMTGSYMTTRQPETICEQSSPMPPVS